MTVKELKEKLSEFPDDATVEVSFTVSCGCCGGCTDEYCYCGDISEDRDISYICPKELKTRKIKNPVVKTVMINV